MSGAFGGLEASAARFEATKRAARDLAEALTAPQLNWRPAPDRWSIPVEAALSGEEVLGRAERGPAGASHSGVRARMKLPCRSLHACAGLTGAC